MPDDDRFQGAREECVDEAMKLTDAYEDSEVQAITDRWAEATGDLFEALETKGLPRHSIAAIIAGSIVRQALQ